MKSKENVELHQSYCHKYFILCTEWKSLRVLIAGQNFILKMDQLLQSLIRRMH